MKIAPALRIRSTMTLSAAGTKSFRIGEPMVVRMPLHGREILHRERKSVQRSHHLAAPELRIAFARLRQQAVAIRQRDDGVHLRIEVARCDRDRPS